MVIPTLLTGEMVVDGLFEKLEVYSLANQDANIYFALLGDYVNASAAEMPTVAAILDSAERRVKELNRKYQKAEKPKFHLFHRCRLRNQSEGSWMGWERKRGKLGEFNRLRRGADDTSFTTFRAVGASLK